MKDSICSKITNELDYDCVEDDEAALMPYYLVKSSELPIFTYQDGFVGLAPNKKPGFSSFL